MHIARNITKSKRARQQLEGLKKLKGSLLQKGDLQEKLRGEMLERWGDIEELSK